MSCMLELELVTTKALELFGKTDTHHIHLPRNNGSHSFFYATECLNGDNIEAPLEEVAEVMVNTEVAGEVVEEDMVERGVDMVGDISRSQRRRIYWTWESTWISR